MEFKQFLTQLASDGQVIVAREPVEEFSFAGFSESFEEINDRLDFELDKNFNSVEHGLLEISKILFDHGINLSQIEGLEEEGDEFSIQLNETTYLYVVFAKNDDDLFDFYAELTDEDGLEEILEDDDDNEEE